MKEDKDFIEYMSNARDEFVMAIKNEERSNYLLTHVDSFLIAYDQIREKVLQSLTPLAVDSGNDSINEAAEKYAEQEFENKSSWEFHTEYKSFKAGAEWYASQPIKDTHADYWDGETNSYFGQAMKDTFDRLSKNNTTKESAEEAYDEYKKFKEWWDSVESLNPVKVFDHIKRYFKPKWQQYASQSNSEVDGLIKELIELKKYHINPYNLGDMGRIAEIIDKLEKLTLTT